MKLSELKAAGIEMNEVMGLTGDDVVTGESIIDLKKGIKKAAKLIEKGDSLSAETISVLSRLGLGEYIEVLTPKEAPAAKKAKKAAKPSDEEEEETPAPKKGKKASKKASKKDEEEEEEETPSPKKGKKAAKSNGTRRPKRTEAYELAKRGGSYKEYLKLFKKYYPEADESYIAKRINAFKSHVGAKASKEE